MRAHSSLILEMLPDGSFRECERMKHGLGYTYLIGIRPDDSPAAPRRSLKVKVWDDTPDGNYWPPDAQIVIRTSAGWSLWRYVFTIVSTVFRRRKTGITNLMLAGVGLGRLAGVPVIRWRASLGSSYGLRFRTESCPSRTSTSRPSARPFPYGRGVIPASRFPCSLAAIFSVLTDSSITNGWLRDPVTHGRSSRGRSSPPARGPRRSSPTTRRSRRGALSRWRTPSRTSART